MKVLYASRALRDIDDILGYIKARSPQGARSVSFAIARDPRRASEGPSQDAQRPARLMRVE